MHPPKEMLDSIKQQLVEAGIARCSICEITITDPDGVITTICSDCGEVSLDHETCAVQQYGAKEVLHTKLRANWRWN